MSVLTEYALRAELKNSNIKEYSVDKSTIVTPSARQYLNDRNIKLVIKKNDVKNTSSNSFVVGSDEADNKFIPKYEGIQGGFYETKPEHMTQLYGNKLVMKDHKRIILRGRLDSLQSRILEAQIEAKKLNENKILDDLEEVLSYVRTIAKAEILEEKLPDISLLKMNSDELREISHNPKKFFGIDHIFYLSYDKGEMAVILNSLRSDTREVEICAFKAFKTEEGKVEREDIITYLNRLSSCFYIMMCKYVAGKYR